MTPAQRFSMLQWGRSFRVAAAPPDGSSDAVERFNLLHCYYIAPPVFGMPRCGYTLHADFRVFDLHRQSTVWVLGSQDSVWDVRACP